TESSGSIANADQWAGHPALNAMKEWGQGGVGLPVPDVALVVDLACRWIRLHGRGELDDGTTGGAEVRESAGAHEGADCAAQRHGVGHGGQAERHPAVASQPVGGTLQTCHRGYSGSGHQRSESILLQPSN